MVAKARKPFITSYAMFLCSNYIVIFNTMAYDIVVGRAFFYRGHAKPDGDQPPCCYVQYIVVGGTVINELCYIPASKFIF